jgi:hypothetical protein
MAGQYGYKCFLCYYTKISVSSIRRSFVMAIVKNSVSMGSQSIGYGYSQKQCFQDGKWVGKRKEAG